MIKDLMTLLSIIPLLLLTIIVTYRDGILDTPAHTTHTYFDKSNALKHYLVNL